jgi:predicted RNA binding protein YcfA (HicA-like mRNA interferase family)
LEFPVWKGFILDRSRGSHQIWLHPASRKRAIVPMHNKDIPAGTLLSILKQADIEKDEL